MPMGHEMRTWNEQTQHREHTRQSQEVHSGLCTGTAVARQDKAAV